MSNNSLNNSNFDLKDRDNIITQLKSQIFDLEQNAKDYNTLQTKCKQLVNEASYLNEEKIRLEYELKQKTQNSNKIISELQSEKANLENSLSEKLLTNKTLFNDNNNLFTSLEEKNQEVENLKEALEERDEIISQLQEEKHNLELILKNLEVDKKDGNDKLLKLNDELDHYNKLCEEQENTIKNLNIEKKNLMEQLGTINYDNKNLTQKLKSTNDNLSIANKQLNDANKTILRLDEDLNQTEKSLSKAKNDINTINNMLNNEKRIKEELQDKGSRLEMAIKEKMDQIKDMGNDIMNLNANLDNVHQDNERMGKEIEKYKAHIMFLTETNQKLINELEAVCERDNQLKMILSQSDEIPDFLNKTRNDIDNALNNLEIGLTSQK